MQRSNTNVNHEPYNISAGINPLGGAINLGYTQMDKTKALTETRSLHKPIEEEMARRKK